MLRFTSYGVLRIWASVLTTFVCAMSAPGVRAAAAYTILDLGTLPSGYGDEAYGVNASGQVVGGHETESGPIPVAHAFRTGGNSPITAASDLGTLGGSKSDAYGINASGQTVGYSYVAGNGSFHAFRTDPNGAITAASDMGTFVGSVSVAFAINDSGQTIGEYYLSGSVAAIAFRTSPNGPITAASELGHLPGGVSSVAIGINAAGQVVGLSTVTNDVNGPAHAFRTDANGPITAASDLGTLGGSKSQGRSINGAGQVVGGSRTTGDAAFHAFRTTANGTITAGNDLGTLGGSESFAFGINASGQAVGYAYTTGDTAEHAFVVDVTGPMQDLNELIPANSGWVLWEATSINDTGQIAGYGSMGGQKQAFLLTPSPEPGSLAIFGFGILGLLARRRGRPR